LFSVAERGKSLCPAVGKPLIFCALGSGISLSVISIVMTGLASGVPSVILFPLFNGLGIIFVCISSVFAFTEKLVSIVSVIRIRVSSFSAKHRPLPERLQMLQDRETK
jgi:multidrug transporter EmrE-like cation transporter